MVLVSRPRLLALGLASGVGGSNAGTSTVGVIVVASGVSVGSGVTVGIQGNAVGVAFIIVHPMNISSNNNAQGYYF